jgi:hypothetical protein
MWGIRSVAPVSRDAAWVAFGEGDFYSVYYYENGTWRPCLEGLPSLWDISLAATPSGKVFVSCRPEPSILPNQLVILCSQDKGTTWHREVVGFGPGIHMRGETKIATNGETLFVSATFVREEPHQNMLYILRRDPAAAGEGVYAEDYSMSDSDNLLEIGALAIRPNGDGYAVGRAVGYHRQGGAWTPQDFSGMPSCGMWDLAAGPDEGDFWAIGQYFLGDEYCRVFVSP